MKNTMIFIRIVVLLAVSFLLIKISKASDNTPKPPHLETPTISVIGNV